LDGEWDFAYSKDKPDINNISFPPRNGYESKMVVPGYWDDNIDKLRLAKFWSRDVNFNPDYRTIDTFPLGSGKPFDASLPYILGTGWYKRRIAADAEWGGKTVTLHIGGATAETWVWVNGEFAGYHHGHMTPFDFDISEHINYGKDNELLIAVSNIDPKRISCSTRGFKGWSAGITRSVHLEITGAARIADSHVWYAENRLRWEVNLRGAAIEPIIDWRIEERRSGKLVQSGTSNVTKWETDTFGMEYWSDTEPNLYDIKFTLRDDTNIYDEHNQPFGMRYAEARGTDILLNGGSVFLRGLTDHAYFPETCTVPASAEFYADTIKKLKRLGFNHIRFHTWTPPKECLDAADALGMLLQVEAPNGFAESDWLDILKACRNHPSVIIYCCGNEVSINAEMMAFLKKMAAHHKNLTPATLFSPMEGLRGVEYELDKAEHGYTETPFPHNAVKLGELRRFSDVFTPHGSIFSYHSVETTDETMAARLPVFGKPCLMHEIGINDSYINLDLEHRYENTRIGTALFAAARAYLKETGMLKRAPRNYQNSCRWMAQIVKYSIENLRRSEYTAGYDLLGAIDCHWHRFGYGVGVMNEFYEPKPGFEAENMLRYNGANVLLANAGTNRNLRCKQTVCLNVYAAIYTKHSPENAVLTWHFTDEHMNIYSKDERRISNISRGKVNKFGVIEIKAPVAKTAKHLKLRLRLTGEGVEINNEWDYWVYPEPVDNACSAEYKTVTALTNETLDYIAEGGRVLLLGAEPFPNVKTSFQIMTSGRTQGNSATAINPHPVTDAFPHDGFLDWQFFSMFHNASAAVFDTAQLPFDPIIEVVSGYKIIRRQSSLFELKIGKGGLLVCTFNINESDAGAAYFHHILLNYISSPHFAPKTEACRESLHKLIESRRQLSVDFSTDEGYDDGGHVKADT
jgi:hypothetical protein